MDKQYMQNYRAGFGTVYCNAWSCIHINIITSSVTQVREYTGNGKLGRYGWEKKHGAQLAARLAY
jgi:hypothetical protein